MFGGGHMNTNSCATEIFMQNDKIQLLYIFSLTTPRCTINPLKIPKDFSDVQQFLNLKFVKNACVFE